MGTTPVVEVCSDTCNGCGVCVSVCPTAVLELHEGKARVVNLEACLGIRAKQSCSGCVERLELCVGCVACVRNCPAAAITITEKSG